MGWVVSGVFAAACLIMWPFLGLSLSPNAGWLVPILAGLYCCHLAPRLVMYRLRYDRTWAALWLIRLAEAVALFMKGGIPFALVSLSFEVYSTLAIRLGLPLRDVELSTLDAFIGFHWLQFLGFVNSSKIASAILVIAYHSFAWQFLFILAVLSFMRMGERISEFVTLYAVTALISAIIATIVPAEGAHAYFAPSREQFSNFTSLSGMWHYDSLVALRAANLMSFNPFHHLEGMVTFPSFHTTAAVLIAYAARGVRFVAIPMLVLNVLMIVSTIPEGGHYLVDVIAGLLIAIVCIVIHARVSPILSGFVMQSYCTAKRTTTSEHLFSRIARSQGRVRYFNCGPNASGAVMTTRWRSKRTLETAWSDSSLSDALVSRLSGGFRAGVGLSGVPNGARILGSLQELLRSHHRKVKRQWL